VLEVTPAGVPGSRARKRALAPDQAPRAVTKSSLFIDEQEAMRGLIAQSSLPCLNVDVSDNDVPCVVEKVTDWLEQAGGLTLRLPSDRDNPAENAGMARSFSGTGHEGASALGQGHGRLASMSAFIAVVFAAVLCGSAAAQARPLTSEEVRVLRSTPPHREANQTAESLARFQAAQALARRLGNEGNADALPLLVELRHVPLLNAFAGAYTAAATPQVEALTLRHLDDPQIGASLVSMLHRLRSPELFDALIQALAAGKIDCEILLGAALSAEAPDVEPRLARLLPRIHPASGRLIARRFADRQYLAGESLLIDLLRRTALDRRSTISDIAASLARLPTDAALNAVARKLVDVARLAQDPGGLTLGLIQSVRIEDIPKDGLLCSTEMLRLPMPLGDSRSREVAQLLRILRIAPADATLDRSLFDAPALQWFLRDERNALEAMLVERTRLEQMARQLTPDNLAHWIAVADARMVGVFIARGADVNAATRMGERPLVLAARTLRAGAVAALLGAGANPNLADTGREGETALHAVGGHSGNVAPVVDAGVRVTKLLLAHHANPRVRNRSGATPLHHAAGGRPELAMLLLDAGADVNAADADGTTPLHRAAHGGQRALARLLLDRGADVNAEELGGVTPLLIARDSQDQELELLFASRGGRINHVYVAKREVLRRLFIEQRGR
jgi:ankyrin repeat protein